MEVDEELEEGLLRQFNCLGTTDKEVLIKELQNLMGPQINEQSAKFYLEMADWNLQAAVCAFLDLQGAAKLPQMTFVRDITIGEGESVPPNTRFIKTWRIQNSGEEPWPSGCCLIFTGGERLGAGERVEVGSPLAPGQFCDVSVEMVSPSATGLYSSKWRMTTTQGNFFGEAIWVIIQVDSGGTLALMQQMVNLKELGSPLHPSISAPSSTQHNPFAPSLFQTNSDLTTPQVQTQLFNGHTNNVQQELQQEQVVKEQEQKLQLLYLEQPQLQQQHQDQVVAAVEGGVERDGDETMS
ncbi:protein ILRUN [Oratosquilla oratoria]|uniref:protein ILRUN n=1 Tax=Oratosquilla oratoria TaxID=337810 RepID=UPI003F7643D7